MGVLWSDKESQFLRFQTLMKEIKSGSINDFGCGYGALFQYLQEIGHQGKYTGYDMNKLMIECAKKRYPNIKSSFYCTKKILFPASFTIVSGTLNLKMNATSDLWWRNIQKILLMCWEYSTEGLAFNLLEKGRNKKPLSNLFYATEKQVVDFCQKNLSTQICIERTQGIHDIHFFIRK